jgi:hypothetical protein
MSAIRKPIEAARVGTVKSVCRRDGDNVCSIAVAPTSCPAVRPEQVQQSASTTARLERSFGRRSSSIIDLNGGRHSGCEDDARRDLIDMDTDRNTLG